MTSTRIFLLLGLLPLTAAASATSPVDSRIPSTQATISGVYSVTFHANEATFQTTWFLISLLTELAVVLVLRTRGPAFRSRPSRLLLWSTVSVCAASLAIPFLGSWSAVFGFVPLSALEMLVVLGIVAGYIVATEAAKAWYYSKMG